MKRLLIVNNNMHIGGVQKALVNLLREISDSYDITLVLLSDSGELKKQIPENVKVIALRSPYRYLGMTKQDVHREKDLLGRSAWAAMIRLFGRKTICPVMNLFQKDLGYFDVAISFLHSGPNKVFYGGCNELVLDKVNAAQKVTFLHCDYEKIEADCRYNRKLYQRFDWIAACSGGCAEAFLRVMPQLCDKVMVVPNCQDYHKIRELSKKERILPQDNRLKVLTVARFGREKGVLRAIQAIADLQDDKKKLSYTIIGDGAEFLQAQEMVKRLDLEDTVRLLGAMENPYGAMAQADLLLIPSVSEAAPMVIGEAACLGTPILTTETISAREMVEKSGYGWVCENSVSGICQSIKMLLCQQERCMERREHLRSCAFDNQYAVKIFSDFIDSFDI